jgi:hypothetical protein
MRSDEKQTIQLNRSPLSDAHFQQAVINSQVHSQGGTGPEFMTGVMRLRHGRKGKAWLRSWNAGPRMVQFRSSVMSKIRPSCSSPFAHQLLTGTYAGERLGGVLSKLRTSLTSY